MDEEREVAFHYLDRYLDRLWNRGRKESTISSYNQIISSLIRFLSDKGLHCSPKLVKEREVMAIIKGYPISDLSKKGYLQVFSRWLVMMADNTVIRRMDLLWPTSNRPGRRWADYDEALEMFEAEEDPTNRMILALAMDEGMRAVEIANMRVSDIEDGWLKVRGKGHRDGKIRAMPMSVRVRKEITRYMRYRTYILSGRDVCDNLLLRENGTPFTSHAISQRVIRMGSKYGNDITAHSLRRRFITDVLNSGVRIEVCSKLVGHENPMVTAMYYNCDRELFEDAMMKRHIYLTGKKDLEVEG